MRRWGWPLIAALVLACGGKASEGETGPACPSDVECELAAIAARILVGERVSDVALDGDRAYVAADGLVILDIEEPEHPVELGRVDVEASRVHIVGDYAFVGGGLFGGFYSVDISDPAVPTLVASLDIEASDFVFRDDLAYVAEGELGLVVIDVSDPQVPLLAGSANLDTDSSHTSVGTAIALFGDLAYVSGFSTVLHIVDVSDPSAPQQVGTWDDIEPSAHLLVVGQHLVVSDPAGIRILDLSDPLEPRQLGNCYSLGAQGMALQGDRLFVADGAVGLRSIDISDATRPTRLSCRSIEGDEPVGVFRIALSDSHAFLSAETAGLYILPLPRD